MKKNTVLVLVLLLSITIIQKSRADTSTISPEYPSLSKGVRPLGMGNAFVAMPGSDENAFFYNPAAINDYEKKFHFRFLSPSVDFSLGSIQLIKDVSNLSKNVNAQSTNSGKTTTFRDFVNAHSGEFQTAQARIPVITVMQKYFAISLLADSRNTISFRNRAFTNIEIFSRSDLGAIMGTAYDFFNGMLQAGLNLKVLERVSIDQVVTVDDIINTSTFKDTVPINKSIGVGADIGLKAKIPTLEKGWLKILKPAVAFTWQDIGNTRFRGNVPNTPQSISLGLSINPELGGWQFHFDNDFRELNQPTAFLNKWNIGAEAMAPRMGKFFQPSIRVGANQGYIAAGASLDFRFVKLEFATYGEDAGKYSHSKQLRRIAGNLSFGF